MIYKIIEKINSNPNSKLFFISPLIYAIGNASEQINIATSYANKRNKKIVIIKIFFFEKLLKYQVCNHSLYEDFIINNKKTNFAFNLFINIFVNIEFFFRRSFILLAKKIFKIKFKEHYYFPNLGINEIYGINKINLSKISYDSIRPFNLKNNLININRDKILYCEKKIKTLNIGSLDNLVCLHVRDHFFRKDENKKNYRNSDINNYIDAINYLIENNFKVIRMGKSGQKINFKHQNFFDYPNLDNADDILDIFLINKCKFYIGTQSGILDVAYMFNKPILTTNMVELYTSYPRKKIDRGIFKKVFSKRDKKKISIEEFSKMSFKYHDPQLEIHDLCFQENSAEDILTGLKEFINVIYNNFKPNFRQIEFKKNLKNQHKAFFNDQAEKQLMLNQVDNLKMIRMLKSCEGYLCDVSLST